MFDVGTGIGGPTILADTQVHSTQPRSGVGVNGYLITVESPRALICCSAKTAGATSFSIGGHELGLLWVPEGSVRTGIDQTVAEFVLPSPIECDMVLSFSL